MLTFMNVFDEYILLDLIEAERSALQLDLSKYELPTTLRFDEEMEYISFSSPTESFFDFELEAPLYLLIDAEDKENINPETLL